jgi:hypothetical protein
MTDLEALDDLARHPGWLLVLQHIESEWGESGFGAKVARTLGDPDMNQALALEQLRQATVAQKAVLGVRDWPKLRIGQLKQGELRAVAGSRRGPGL